MTIAARGIRVAAEGDDPIDDGMPRRGVLPHDVFSVIVMTFPHCR